MVDFTRQREFTTREAALPVDGGLPPGVHVFQLVVEDTSGNRSKAAQVKIQIDPVRIPVTPVIPVTPTRPVIPTGSVTPTTPIIGRSRRPKKKTP